MIPNQENESKTISNWQQAVCRPPPVIKSTWGCVALSGDYNWLHSRNPRCHHGDHFPGGWHQRPRLHRESDRGSTRYSPALELCSSIRLFPVWIVEICLRLQLRLQPSSLLSSSSIQQNMKSFEMTSLVWRKFLMSGVIFRSLWQVWETWRCPTPLAAMCLISWWAWGSRGPCRPRVSTMARW